jgi:hypothetical protein
LELAFTILNVVMILFVDILRKVELNDKQKLEMYYLIKKYLKM